MSQMVTRKQLKEMLESDLDFKLVEVLDPKEYRKFHLPGAMNVPNDDNFAEEIQRAIPGKNEKIVVYCQNKECPASAQAARKLDQLGYTDVLDYEAGKEDWKEADLPIEGPIGASPPAR